MAISDQFQENLLNLVEENLNNTTTLPNYQSILLTDPEAVPSDVDVSQLRTQTDTNPELLAAISEFPGLKFDTTSYDQYSDLYDLYSGGLPMTGTSTTATTPTQDFTGGQIIDTSGQDQVTGGLTTDLTTDPINTDTSMYGGDLDQGGAGDGITNYEYTPEETAEQQQAIDQSIQDLGSLYNPMTEVPTDPAIADAALSGSFYVPNQTGAEIEQPSVLDNISTAARNAFETVKDGTSTAVDFISSYGYPAYQALSGNLVAAGASLLNPLTLGLGFAGKVFEGLGDTASKQEYDSYSDEQKTEIDKAYAPGGIMQGYNAVSQFGQGVSGTVEDRIDKLEEVIANPNRDTSNVYTIDKDGNKIFNPSFNSAEKQLAELKNLQDKGGLTKRPTQDEIFDRDDVDPADEGFTQSGTFGGNPTYSSDGSTVDSITGDITNADGTYAGNIVDESGDLTGTAPVDDFEVSGDVGTSASDVFDTAFGPAPSPNPAIADAALSESFYVGDSGSDSDTSSSPSPSPSSSFDYESDAYSGSISNAANQTANPQDSSQGSSSSGSSKIVCTMMNQTYGFGSFRNKIWLKQSKDLAPEYQKGYHKIFLPLVRLSKTNIVIRKILEHIAVHRTMDIRQESRGKTHILGRVYRKVLEPICYLVGKYVK